jgi:lipoprotein-anchoring transpeptidase ErfK/SrfK
MRDQHSEANPSVVSVSKWPLSYPTASVHVAGLVITHSGKPISKGWSKQKMYKESKDENQPDKVDLSEKARENLRKNAESRQSDSKFMKLQAGEKKNVQINPDGIRQTIAEFNGNKTKRYEYPVIDLGSGSNQEKCLTVGKRTSEDIDAFLLEGQNRIRIQRLGLGKDTRYLVSALN